MGSSSGLLAQLSFEEDGPELFSSFLRADFDEVLKLAMVFWENHPELTTAGAERQILEDDRDDRLAWYFTVELVRALGLFADSIRRGDNSRLERATAKLEALDMMAARTFSDDVSILISLFSQVGKRYSAASIYNSVRSLGELNPERMPRLMDFARGQFAHGRGILWSSQRPVAIGPTHHRRRAVARATRPARPNRPAFPASSKVSGTRFAALPDPVSLRRCLRPLRKAR